MNFLAHIYLSGEGDELLSIGNFIADTVRGKEYLQYPEAMPRGILLHRRIDTFTDAHAIFRKVNTDWCLLTTITQGCW